MPVYEVRYKPWEGALTPLPWRWLAVPKFSFMALSGRAFNWSLFGLGSAYFLVLFVFLAVTNNEYLLKLLEIGKTPSIPPDRILRSFLFAQTFICQGALLLAGPRLIAPERAHGGLSILFARPITRIQYILGKLVTMGAAISFLTWIQAVAVWVVMFATYPSTHAFHTDFTGTALPLLAGSMAYGMLISLSLSAVAVGGSSFSPSIPVATNAILMMLYGASAVAAFLGEKLAQAFYCLALLPSLTSVGQHLFGMGESATLSPVLAFAGVLAWVAIPLAVTVYKVRPVEIHKD